MTFRIKRIRFTDIHGKLHAYIATYRYVDGGWTMDKKDFDRIMEIKNGGK